MEDDTNASSNTVTGYLFQSTSPVWRTTSKVDTARIDAEDFNPRPPCGGRRLADAECGGDTIFQSTSPVWRTTQAFLDVLPFRLISIHVPRVEDDGNSAIARATGIVFQSTSPVWRTTGRILRYCASRFYFNPRPPCGGRRASLTVSGLCSSISIHVPRVEDDVGQKVKAGDVVGNFNPRPPCGGRLLKTATW